MYPIVYIFTYDITFISIPCNMDGNKMYCVLMLGTCKCQGWMFFSEIESSALSDLYTFMLDTDTRFMAPDYYQLINFQFQPNKSGWLVQL